MGMDIGGPKKGVSPAMNVTPLVDVVLVLLIIFMVVTPLLTKQLFLNVPPKPEENAPPPPPDTNPPIVLTLTRDGVTRVNNEIIPRDQLGERINRMLNARADKIVFFDAESGMDYGAALEALDSIRGAGVETIAVLADEVAGN